MLLYRINAGAIEVTVPSAQAYLKRELGLEYVTQRNTQAQSAMADPQAYNLARAALVKTALDSAAVTYKSSFEKFAVAGYSEDQCKTNAREHAKAVFRVEENLVNLTHPEKFSDIMLKVKTEGQMSVMDVLGDGASKTRQTRVQPHKKRRNK